MRPDGSSGLCIDHADIYVHGEWGIRRPNCSRGNYIPSPVGECHERGEDGSSVSCEDCANEDM